MNTRIVVDTSVWIDFFVRTQAPATLRLKQLLRDRRVVMVGMVLAEILQGIKNSRESKQVQETVGHLPYQIWRAVRAGRLSNNPERCLKNRPESFFEQSI